MVDYETKISETVARERVERAKQSVRRTQRTLDERKQARRMVSRFQTRNTSSTDNGERVTRPKREVETRQETAGRETTTTTSRTRATDQRPATEVEIGGTVNIKV